MYPLSGYRIFYWSDADTRVHTIDVPDPDVHRLWLSELSSGDYCFSMVAYDERGIQSGLSAVVRKTVR